MKLKNWFVVVIVLTILVLLVLIDFFWGQPTQTPLPSPAASVIDWSVLPQTVDSAGTTLYENTASYQLYFSPEKNEYTILVFGSPFSAAKQRAEDAFLKQFSLTKEEACKLNVSISTPAWANEIESGQAFTLGFCQIASPNP